LKYTIYILYTIGCALSIIYGINHFTLSPDSTNYITAAENLVNHHSLFVNGNWPSGSYEPVTEPYTEYMPGLPVFTSVILLFAKNPDLVMLTMNSLSVALMFFISLLVLIELKLNDYLKIIFLLFLIFFEPFRHIYSHYWTETHFIFFSLLSVYFALKLLKQDKKSYWIWGCVAIVLSSFVKIYGVLNCAFFIIPFILNKKSFAKLILFVFCSSLFAMLWYLRNEIMYGYFTLSHQTFRMFRSELMFTPFAHTLYLLGNDKLANVWMKVILIVSLSPLMIYFKNKSFAKVSISIWSLLCIGTTIQFLALYILSLISSFDYLRSRLLAPVYILCFLILLFSIKILMDKYSHVKIKYVIAALPLLLFFSASGFEKQIDLKINFTAPLEHALWDELSSKDFVNNSSHYITDDDFNHQIYGKLPQRIVKDSIKFSDVNFMREILGKGRTPFIVLRNNESPYFSFEHNYKLLGYKKAETQNKDFIVYIRE